MTLNHLQEYFARGWHPLPLPPRAKTPPPGGYTGAHGTDATPEELAAWAQQYPPDSNIALRMPDGVIGLDVDSYGDKPGAETLGALVRQLGPLPQTWVSTSRGSAEGPGSSGIAFYRVPAGLTARSLGGEGIEIVQRRHRYAVVSPSVNPKTGTPYCWYSPDGSLAPTPPTAEELPELPEQWVAWLARPASETPMPAGAGETAALLAWLDAAGGLAPCVEVASLCHTAAARMQAVGQGGRHDTMTGLTYRLLATAAQGHHGWAAASNFLRELWAWAVPEPGREAEFEQMLTTAAAKVAGDWTDGPQLADPCLVIYGAAEEYVPPLDLGGCFSDRDIAAALLQHSAGRLLYLTDVDRFGLWSAQRQEWEFALGLSPDAAGRVLVHQELTYALRGDFTADKGSEDRARADNRISLSNSKGAGSAVTYLLAQVREPSFPGRLRYSSLDTEPDTLWAGGTPWDLTASLGRLVRADLDPRTPHYRTAPFAPDLRPTPLWDRFFSAAIPDATQREWAYTLLGGTLLGRGAKVLLVLQGVRDSGKTQILTLVSSLLGTEDQGYATAASRKLLMDDNEHDAILMQLSGRRLAWVDEGLRYGKASLERLKALTGGGYQTGRWMRSNPVTFKPTHTMAVTTNEMPEVVDEALRSRVRLLQLDNDLAEVHAARAAIGDLSSPEWQAEAPGVLGRLITYAAHWAQDPSRGENLASVAALLDQTAAEQDPLSAWIIEQTSPDGWSSASNLWADFRAFARDQGIPDHRIGTANGFGRALRGRGVARRHTKDGAMYELILRRFKGPDLGGAFGPAGGRAVTQVTDDESVTPQVPVSAENVSGQTGFGVSGETVTDSGPQVTDRDGFSDNPSPHFQRSATRTITSEVTDMTDLDTSSTSHVSTKGGSTAVAQRKCLQSVTSVNPSPPGTPGLPAVKVRNAAPQHADLGTIQALLAATLGRTGGRITLDVEHTGFPIGHPLYELRTIQLGDAQQVAVLDARIIEHVTLAVEVLDAAQVIHAHSATADIIPVAVRAGLSPDRWWPKVTDTGILAALTPPEQLASPEAWGLKDLAKRIPDSQIGPADAARAQLWRENKWIKDTTEDTTLERNGWYQVDPAEPRMIDYAASDVLDTHALADMLLPQIPQSTALLERERTVQRILARITHRGIALDADRVAEQLRHHTAACEPYTQALAAAGVVNPNSPAQVARALEAAGLDGQRTQSGALTTGTEALDPVAPQDPNTKVRPRTNPAQALCADILDYRHHETLRKMFLRGFDLQCRQGDGRIRPTILTLGAAATGRMSATRPNVQQIPKTGGLREMFLADPGETIIAADFSSVEVRVAAWVTGDLHLARLIRDGLDLHALIAEVVWGRDWTKAHRYAAKRAVFGWLYGASMKRVALQLGQFGERAHQVVDALTTIAPGMVQWRAQLQSDVRSGRRPYWQHASGRITWLPSKEPHKALNYIVQSTARELLVESLLRLEAAVPGLSIMPVHDEIVAFVPIPLAQYALAHLTEAMRFDLPMPDGTVVPIVSEPDQPQPRWWDAA